MNQQVKAKPHEPRPCPAGCVEAGFATRIVAAASDLALVVQQDGTIQEVTVGDSAVARAAWDELVGKRWSETIAPDSKAKVEQLLLEARAGQVARPREINQKAESGAEVPFRFSAVALGDEHHRVMALGRDLSPVSVLQKQMVATQQMMDREFERLRQAENRYRLLFRITAEAVVVADTATLKILEANPAAASFFGAAAPALQGRPLQELFNAAGWDELRGMIAALESGGRPPQIPIQLRSSERQMLASASLFRQSGGSLLLLRLLPVAGQAGSSAPSARDARILAAVDALPDGFVVIGQDRRILSANPAFCDMAQQANEAQVLGQPLDRWLGRPRVDLNILVTSLREHGSVRNFATILTGDYGGHREALVSAVAALEAKVPCYGFVIRTTSAQLGEASPAGAALPRSIDQLRELVGRVPLKDIVRESTDLIERLCIQAALKVSGDNRASAALLLGLSRQGLYSKLRRHGLGDLDPTEIG
jgi:transcriptional regulator PpsR